MNNLVKALHATKKDMFSSTVRQSTKESVLFFSILFGLGTLLESVVFGAAFLYKHYYHMSDNAAYVFIICMIVVAIIAIVFAAKITQNYTLACLGLLADNSDD